MADFSWGDFEDVFDDASLLDLSFDDEIHQNSIDDKIQLVSPQVDKMQVLEHFHFESQNFPKQRISKSKKDIYGKGDEKSKLINLPHYGEPFKHRKLYIQLGCPTKEYLNELGEKYTHYFKTNNKSKTPFPHFGRYQKRNKGLAYWFFEDNIDIVIPWLKSIGLLQ